MNVKVLFSVTTSVVAFACGDNSGDAERAAPVLLSDDATAMDSTASNLASALRQFIDAVARNDSTALARSLASDAVAVDLRPEATADGRAEPVEIRFFEILAGALTDRLRDQYHTYSALPSDDIATVYALGSQSGVRTSWRRTDSSWKVLRITILRSEDTLENLERDRARVKPATQ